MVGSTGIDIHFNHSIDAQCSSSLLPILEETFNCVCIISSLIYISKLSHKEVLKECHRVLKKYGRLIITCTTPLGGFVHRLFRWRQPRGMSRESIMSLVEKDNLFRLVYDKPFMLGLNRVYVFGKETQKVESYVPIQQIIKKEIHEGLPN